MTKGEHYRKSLAYLAEVEDAERNWGNVKDTPEMISAINQNMMRILKKAEIHALLAQAKGWSG